MFRIGTSQLDVRSTLTTLTTLLGIGGVKRSLSFIFVQPDRIRKDSSSRCWARPLIACAIPGLHDVI